MDNTFAETERLILRQMSEKDFSDIAEMLKNPNVMYAWEYVFDDIDVLKWIKKNREYYKADKYLQPLELKTELLNGAQDWEQYSWGGCSLIDDSEIAERLCTPSELKTTRNGERKPNRREEWLDVQARALFQAANRIIRAARA